MTTIRQDIQQKAEEAVHRKIFPGCVVGWVNRDGERDLVSAGHFTYEDASQKVKEDTLYDVASITKSIPTASLALMLIDQGLLNITDKLIEYVPEFRNSDRERVLIKHLLTYTLDGYGIAALYVKPAQEITDYIFSRDFEKRPGTVFKYTNIPAFLLGLVIERVTKKPLEVLADEYFFNPLEMKRTSFFPERFLLEEIVPTEIGSWRGRMHGVVHDESAWAFKREGKIVGHAGLFSTVPDLLTFLEMLLHKGSFQGKKYFSSEIIAQMGTNQIPELGECTALGWELNQPRYMGTKCGPHTFGKTGFTGTVCVCDVEKGVAFVVLSNRTYPTRSEDSHAINAFRASIGNIIFATE